LHLNAIRSSNGIKVKTGLIFLFSFFIISVALAQQPGKVEIIKDPRIDSLMAAKANQSKSAAGGTITTDGYRVQIFSGSERQGAYDAQNQFKSLRGGVATYLSYTEPFYKIQVGDFRTRLEAQKLVNELRQYFPTLIIVPGRINQSQ
jgi:hypothetical protein